MILDVCVLFVAVLWKVFCGGTGGYWPTHLLTRNTDAISIALHGPKCTLKLRRH